MSDTVSLQTMRDPSSPAKKSRPFGSAASFNVVAAGPPCHQMWRPQCDLHDSQLGNWHRVPYVPSRISAAKSTSRQASYPGGSPLAAPRGTQCPVSPIPRGSWAARVDCGRPVLCGVIRSSWGPRRVVVACRAHERGVLERGGPDDLPVRGKQHHAEGGPALQLVPLARTDLLDLQDRVGPSGLKREEPRPKGRGPRCTLYPMRASSTTACRLRRMGPSVCFTCHGRQSGKCEVPHMTDCLLPHHLASCEADFATPDHMSIRHGVKDRPALTCAGLQVLM